MISIYNSTTQTVNVGGAYVFDTNRIVTGCTVSHTAGTPTISLVKPGYYYVTFNADVTGTTAGDVTAQLINGATPVPGAEATTTVTVGGVSNIAFATIIKVLPSCSVIDNTTTLTVLNSGIAVDYTNANINITKLC